MPIKIVSRHHRARRIMPGSFGWAYAYEIFYRVRYLRTLSDTQLLCQHYHWHDGEDVLIRILTEEMNRRGWLINPDRKINKPNN